jgi:hypothetical protein
VVAAARLGSRVLQSLAALSHAGSIGKVDDIHFRFLAHGLKRGTGTAEMSRRF